MLLIDDDPEYTFLMREMLTAAWDAPFHLQCADRLSNGLKQLTMGDADVILLDLLLPDSQGLDTFVQVHAQVPDTPIIVLSNLKDEELATKAIQKGAQDYLLKGQTDVNDLRRAIRHAIGRKRAKATPPKAALRRNAAPTSAV